MGKSIISKGKTVKDAVNTALQLLGVKKNEVDIEIFEHETKGIFGIGAKPAIVRVTAAKREADKSAEANEEASLEMLEHALNSFELNDGQMLSSSATTKRPAMDDLSGKVWVQDGQIFCKDAPDKYPLVSPVAGVRFYKNNELIEKAVVIREEDSLTVDLQDELHEPSWEIKLSENKMEAILEVTPGFRIIRRLKEAPPNSFVQLEVVESKVFLILETILILDKLKELGIVNGIDYSELAAACTCEQSGSFVIAAGNQPSPGKQGYFVPMQEVDIKKRLKERADGTLDYREVQEFPSVERGQVIGNVIPPEAGIPGRTVTNEPVFPPEVLPLVVKAGKGVVLVEDTSKVIAVDAGMPQIHGKGQLLLISVVPKLLIGKDVDLKTGNVRYVGDVEVTGTVQDGMLVEAQGNILIRINSHSAKIISGCSVVIQNNIINSEITAGKSTLLREEIYQILGDVIEQMKQMATAIQQLSMVSAFKVTSFTRTGLGPLLKILCDGKFKAFPAKRRELINKIKSCETELGEEWIEYRERLDKGFHPTHPSHLQSIDELFQLITRSGDLHASIHDSNDDQTCFIKASFAHNSQLYSSGDIALLGQGSYNSKIHARGFIEVSGFIRGGEIYAAKGVNIEEAGTKCGGFTKISVSSEGTIRIKHVLEDTVIQVGTKSHKFTVQSSRVYARLDDNGELILT
ncbi:FapA family protein [Paenibacillus frigoriresistens]|uniref:FapA family protein n=1 Tax=Paenibacillus alginolyticus TaxID=59839 RepID=UPI0015647928|nr:FapA family protein [Paenibacillus frigoriresistens]NRF95575.1 FapA family protein [Paenibacillus frigoriresistens]